MPIKQCIYESGDEERRNIKIIYDYVRIIGDEHDIKRNNGSEVI